MNRLQSTAIISQIILLVIMGACGKSKNKSADAVALTGAEDAVVETDGGTVSTAGACLIDDADEQEADDDADEDADEGADEAAKPPKAKKDKKDKEQAKCQAGTSTTTSTTPAPSTAGTAGASLAEGQKIYNANCQGCHGALPGQKQGVSAATILSASGIGPHKGITPWPNGQASALSAQIAADSLAMAMK